jgi:hypothetical protein
MKQIITIETSATGKSFIAVNDAILGAFGVQPGDMLMLQVDRRRLVLRRLSNGARTAEEQIDKLRRRP